MYPNISQLVRVVQTTIRKTPTFKVPRGTDELQEAEDGAAAIKTMCKHVRDIAKTINDRVVPLPYEKLAELASKVKLDGVYKHVDAALPAAPVAEPLPLPAPPETSQHACPPTSTTLGGFLMLDPDAIAKDLAHLSESSSDDG